MYIYIYIYINIYRILYIYIYIVDLNSRQSFISGKFLILVLHFEYQFFVLSLESNSSKNIKQKHLARAMF